MKIAVMMIVYTRPFMLFDLILRLIPVMWITLALFTTSAILFGEAALLHEGIIAFSTPVDRVREWHVVMMDVRTRHFVRLGEYGWRVAVDLQWSPDGGQLAFATFAPGSDIYVIDVYRRKIRNITHNQAGNRYPSWSPDGSTLIFVTSRDSLSFDVNVAGPDGGDSRLLTSGEFMYPAWSPDGSQIVISSRTRGNLYTINTDGSNLRQLTFSTGDDRNPAWSPDGRQIAYVSFVTALQGAGDRIFVMNADGSDNRMLLPNLPAQGMPSWSPDSRYIAFIGRGQGENYDSLYVTDPNPENPPRKLADHAYYAYHERWSMWSPDSRYIAFSRRDIGGLYVVEISSGQIRKLSDLMTMYPVWQPAVD